MKKTHKQKVKMARKMRSKIEIRTGKGKFVTKAWLDRKEQRAKKEIVKGLPKSV